MTHLPIQDRLLAPSGPLTPVVTYWESLRRGRSVPARADLDPLALEPWLGFSGIVERGRPDRVRLRVAGRGLSRMMGVEARGMPLRAMFAVGTRPRLRDYLDAVFDGSLVLHLALVGPAATQGARPVHVPMVLLPLSDGAGAVTRALLCLAPDTGTEVETPCRFHIRQARLSHPGGRPCGAPPARRDAPRDLPGLRLISGGLA